MKITIACPSYKRINNILRLVDSVRDTSYELNQIEIFFYLDNDDYDSHEIVKKLMIEHGTLIKGITGPKINLSDMWNQCSNHTSSEIVMFCGDDIVFRTLYWDKIVIDQFNLIEDKIAFIHGDDGYNKDLFGTHGFLHRDWINTVGYLLPPYFSADWCDTWINDVANKLQRRIYVPILTEHMHYSVNKGEMDETHLQRLQRGQRDNNKLIYDEKKIERDVDFLKLKTFILEHRISMLL